MTNAWKLGEPSKYVGKKAWQTDVVGGGNTDKSFGRHSQPTNLVYNRAERRDQVQT